jgi:NAD/NADP transhydrogenase beta subunit
MSDNALATQSSRTSFPAFFSSWRLRACRIRRNSRQGNLYGMVGMAIAIVTTLLLGATLFRAVSS